ncbi:hypothetical protein EGW08_014586 [Elysia chlorotica]|uniref:Rho-GAP domain-containing protein n=1 Tax=Elysia chlorotica TaxID=188477 RepID=A0A433T7Y0_ELYCH|nr:hypothetical protein EGW08_014586 [Elysia chlorotica]
MGDLGPQLVMDLRARSMNNIAVEDEITEKTLEEVAEDEISPEELDSILVSMETGLGLALQRAKVWSKYIADIIAYIDKKAQLELDYAKNISRLAHSLQHSLKKEGFLPLQSVYCTVLNQDTEFASNLQITQSLLQAQKFIDPLTARRSEHDKVYKSVKDVWHREYRKMTESVTNLRKAQALYNSRQQDRDRARELALKADGEKQEKRRKAEEEAMHKAAEAETTYKACVAEANYRQHELFKVKGEQLARIREQIQMCDQVMKEVTTDYFQLYHTIVSPLPLQYLTLSESSKNYVPGSQYAEYVRRLPNPSRPCQPAVFMFEPYIQGQKPSEAERKESVHSNGSVSELHSPEGSPVTSPRRDKYRIPVKAWGQQVPGGTSDTDSASCSSKSHESSPSGSPHRGQRRLVSSHSLDELTEEEILAAAAAASSHHHKDKRAHQMKRMMSVQGADNLQIPGLLMGGRTHRRNTTFGVDFQEQVDTFQTKVPPIVSKCLEEIEKRGHMVKGIYRVSGVKSKVEHLCQRFDIDPEAVDLSDVHPNIISNVLKLYLRQLPEPLLTFRLYPEFIHTAKENMSGQLVGDQLIEKLQKLIRKLPSSNLRTSAVLMHHLQRVADNADVNQMSASNLGIVFGPTLLRPLEGSASLASLVDTPHQTRAIELLVTHAHVVFGPSEDFQVTPDQTPIEQLEEASAQGQKSAKKNLSEPTSSDIADEETSGLGTSFSGGGTSSGPSPCEFVLPGMANQDRNDSQSIAINAERDLAMTKPDSQTVRGASQPMAQVTKSASSPSVAHLALISQPATIAGEAKSKSEVLCGDEKMKATESHQSTACKPETEESNKLREEASERKRPHSQQLKNIMYLTKAPSMEGTVDDFYPKTTFVPADPPGPPVDSKSSPCIAADIGPPSLAEKPISDKKAVAPPCSKPVEMDSKPVCAQTTPSSLVSPASTTQARPSQATSISSSRRSILEEMPIPTMSSPPPARSSSSDGGKSSEAAMTIPASPTIKRREISRIPTSPQLLRAADNLDSRKHDKWRQQQRKLVTAIKTDPKIGAGSPTSSTSSQPSEKEKPASKVDRSSVVLDDFSGGCALSSRPSSQNEETLGMGRKSVSDQDRKDKTLQTDNKQTSGAENRSDPTMERRKILENKTQSPPTVRSMGPIKTNSPKLGESSRQKLQPFGSPSLAKPRQFNTSCSSPSKKQTTSAVTASSGSSKSTGSLATAPSTAKPTSTSSSISSSTSTESLKRSTPSIATSSSQSATQSSRPAKSVVGTSSSLNKSNSEDGSVTTASLSGVKPSPVASSVTRKGSGRAGDTPTSFSKPTRKTTTGAVGVQSRKEGSDSSPARQRKLSSEAASPGQPPSKPIQGRGTPTGSPRRVHERSQGLEAAGKQGGRSQKASQASASVKASPPTTSASTASTSSTSAGTAASSKLSQDRTPRFV